MRILAHLCQCSHGPAALCHDRLDLTCDLLQKWPGLISFSLNVINSSRLGELT
jgi:hypothetical protein